MQSYSQQVDDTLVADQLPSLGERLVMPAGWSFHVRTLQGALVVEPEESAAVVLQDELRNTYQPYAPAAK